MDIRLFIKFKWSEKKLSLGRALVPSLIEGLRVVQGPRVVPVFLYRYSMKVWKRLVVPGLRRGADQTRH